MNVTARSVQAGLTLTELLVASALSLTVIAAMTTSYVAGHRSSQAIARTMQQRQDARHGLFVLAQDLRKAGHFGCATMPDVMPLPAPGLTDPVLPATNGIRVLEADDSAWLAGSGMTPSSKLIEVHYGTGNTPFTPPPSPAEQAPLEIRQLTIALNEQAFPSRMQRVALASCQRIDLLQVASSHLSDPQTVRLTLAQPLPLSHPLAGKPHHLQSLEVMRVVSRAYLTGSVNGQAGLYRFEIDEQGNKRGPIEIAPDIRDLVVEYGRPSRCRDNRLPFEFSTQAGDWRQVRLLRLTVRARPGQIEQQDGYPAADRRYSTVVSLNHASPCIDTPPGTV
jgi:type IV pilus assembly protein PilW